MRKISKAILIICTVMTLLFIWVQSALPGNISTQESGFVMKLATPVLELFVGKGNVTEHLVRKLAHFTEFSVLGVEAELIFGSMLNKNGHSKWKTLFPAVAGCASAAFMDETIQIFSGRGPAIADVWIDTAGAALGAAVAWLILFLTEKGKRKYES